MFMVDLEDKFFTATNNSETVAIRIVSVAGKIRVYRDTPDRQNWIETQGISWKTVSAAKGFLKSRGWKLTKC